jgi:hypothetical protein
LIEVSRNEELIKGKAKEKKSIGKKKYGYDRTKNNRPKEAIFFVEGIAKEVKQNKDSCKNITEKEKAIEKSKESLHTSRVYREHTLIV